MRIEKSAEFISQLPLAHAVLYISLLLGALYLKGQTTVELVKIFIRGLKDTIPYMIKFLGFLFTLGVAFLTDIITSNQFSIAVLGLVMSWIIYLVADESNQESNETKNSTIS